MSDLSFAESGPLLKNNIRSTLKHNFGLTVPTLIVLLETLTLSGPCKTAVVKDPTGRMNAMIHQGVLDVYSRDLVPGSVLVLNKVPVFPSRHDRNLVITVNNVVTVIRPDEALPDGVEVCLYYVPRA